MLPETLKRANDIAAELRTLYEFRKFIEEAKAIAFGAGYSSGVHQKHGDYAATDILGSNQAAFNYANSRNQKQPPASILDAAKAVAIAKLNEQIHALETEFESL